MDRGRRTTTRGPRKPDHASALELLHRNIFMEHTSLQHNRMAITGVTVFDIPRIEDEYRRWNGWVKTREWDELYRLETLERSVLGYLAKGRNLTSAEKKPTDTFWSKFFECAIREEPFMDPWEAVEKQMDFQVRTSQA